MACRRGARLTEVESVEPAAGREVAAIPGRDDAPVLEHDRAVGVLQDEVSALLGDEEAQPLFAVQASEALEDLGDDAGARPMEGSSSRSSFGRVIRARPMATICCSPPEVSPARVCRRSLRRGNHA